MNAVENDIRALVGKEGVAVMMALLKIARIATGHGKADNWVGGELEVNAGE